MHLISENEHRSDGFVTCLFQYVYCDRIKHIFNNDS